MKHLIIGLGNPGAEYEETRHNIGFKVVDTIAEAHGGKFSTERHGAVSTIRFKSRTLVLLKPSTFMNLSGKALRYWMIPRKYLQIEFSSLPMTSIYLLKVYGLEPKEAMVGTTA